MEGQPWYFLIGFAAQGLFSIRVLIQWVLSEKAHKVVSPTIYWQLSLLASFLFSIYGWLRGDFAIILGQFIAYYIYIWNLYIKNYWKEVPAILRIIIMVTPLVAMGYIVVNGDDSVNRLFSNISLKLLLFGSAGQVILTCRFIYQWWYSQSRRESLLPAGFWILSLAGSAITLTYGIYRLDPVLILGQSAGFIAYGRNLWLLKKKNVA